jgi:hypothetical protein
MAINAVHARLKSIIGLKANVEYREARKRVIFINAFRFP